MARTITYLEFVKKTNAKSDERNEQNLFLAKAEKMCFMRKEFLSLADESRQWDLQGQVRKVPGHLITVPTFLSRPIQ